MLGPARRDGLWLERVLVLAALCAHPEATPEERAEWRTEGAERCDAMDLLPGAWLRAVFG